MFRGPARAASPSTRSLPKGSAGTSSRYPPTPGSFLAEWKNPTSITSRGSARPSRSTRRVYRKTRAQRSGPSPRFTTTYGCCSQEPGVPIATTAADLSNARPFSRSSTRSWRSTRAPGFRYLRRWSLTCVASTSIYSKRRGTMASYVCGSTAKLATSRTSSSSPRPSGTTSRSLSTGSSFAKTPSRAGSPSRSRQPCALQAAIWSPQSWALAKKKKTKMSSTLSTSPASTVISRSLNSSRATSRSTRRSAHALPAPASDSASKSILNSLSRTSRSVSTRVRSPRGRGQARTLRGTTRPSNRWLRTTVFRWTPRCARWTRTSCGSSCTEQVARNWRCRTRRKKAVSTAGIPRSMA